MNSKKLFGIFCFAIIAVAAAYMLMTMNSKALDTNAMMKADTKQTETVVAKTETESKTVPDIMKVADTATEPMAATHAAIEASAGGEIDIEKAMEVRGLGDPNAPVVIEEFASLSCPHCATFYNETFPELKENYIDTGKVYFIYHDFPLNKPALEGAMISRCMPHQHYFKFVKFLFKNQENWAFTQDSTRILIQNAKLLGASEELAQSCLKNEELAQKLIQRMQEMGEKYQVKSTPSFVMNKSEPITGSLTYKSFKKAIDKALEKNEATR